LWRSLFTVTTGEGQGGGLVSSRPLERRTEGSPVRPRPAGTCALGPTLLTGRCATVLFTVTTFFVGFLPVEILFQRLGGRTVKLAVWAALLGLSFLVVMAHAWHTIRWDRLRRFVICGLLLFSIYSAFQAGFRPPPFSWQQTLVAVILVPVFALMGLAAARHKATVVAVLLFLSAVYVLSGAVGLYAGYIEFGQGRLPQTIFPADLYDHETAGYQGTSRYVGLFVLCGFGWGWFRWKSLLLRALLLASCGMALTLLLILGGRSAAVALAVALTFLMAMKLRPVVTRLKVRPGDAGWLACMGFLAAVAAFVGFSSESLLVNRFIWMLQEGGAAERGVLFSSALGLWTKDGLTLFFGLGPQAFPMAAGFASEGMYPHNFILEALCEYGLVGCALLCAPLAAVAPAYAGSLRPAARPSHAALALGAIGLFLFVQFMATGSLASLWPLVFLWTALVPESGWPGRRPATPRGNVGFWGPRPTLQPDVGGHFSTQDTQAEPS